MKITDIDILAQVTIPYSDTCVLAWHNPYIKPKLPELRTNILRIETDEGITGFGEGVDEQELQKMKPDLMGKDPFDVELVVETLFYPYLKYIWNSPRYYLTGAAVEIACWDIIGKALKVPVYKMMGGKLWEKVPITRFMGITSPKEAAKEAVDAVEQGVRTIKLKVGFDAKQDIEIVKSVRDAIGDGPALRVDSNQAWSVGTAINLLNKLSKYDIQYVEQPLPRWDREGLARLRERVGVPICVCEGWGYEHHADKLPILLHLIKDHAIDFLSTDPMRTGGLLAFKKTCAICEAAGIPVILHWNLLGISTAAWLHACVSNRATMYAHDIHCPNIKPGPIDDIITEPFLHENGYVKVPEGPGLGVTLNKAKLEKWRFHAKDLEKEKKTLPFPIENLRIENYSPPRY